MALTTTKFFNRRYGSSANGYNFWFEVDETATNNIANTSTCDIKYYGEQTSAYAYSGNSYTYYRFSVDDGAFTDWLNVRAINAGQGKPVLLMSQTGVTIPHDSDGTKVLTLVGEYTRSQVTAGTGTTVSTNEYIPIGTATGTSEANAKFSFSGTVTLTALDRQSTITSVNNINAGSTQTVVFTPHSTSFYYRVQFKNGSSVLATENIGKATTAETAKSYTSTYAFPTSLLPNTTSATLTAVLYTYADSGYSTLIGSDSKTFTLSIASSVVPSYTSGYPTVTPDNSANSWLASNASSLWVSGYSKAYVVAKVSAGSGATISSVKTTNAFNATLSWNSSATAYTYTSAVLSAGSKTVRVTVTDSRGRTAYVDKSFTVATYSAPTVTLTAERGTGTGSSWVADDSGTTIRATAVVGTSVNAANTANVTFTCGTSQTVNNVANGGTATAYFTDKSAESAFVVTAKAVDKVGVTGATSSQTVSTEVVPFSWNEDRLGFGKVGEAANTVDSAWDIQVKKASNSATSVQAINPLGNMALHTAASGNRGLYDATTGTAGWIIYRRHSDGKVLIPEYVPDGIIFYGTCSTAAATQAKEATVANTFALTTGVSVRIKFTNAQTYNGQPTLNVNSTGAKGIVRNGTTAAVQYYWAAGEVVDLTYDGTNWVRENGTIATTTYYGLTKLSSSTSSTSTAMAATPSAVKAAYDLASAAVPKAGSMVQVWSNTSGATSGNWSNFANYSAYLLLGRVTNGGSLVSMTIPADLFVNTTTASSGLSVVMSDEVAYATYYLYYSGTTGYFSRKGATNSSYGKLYYIYGIY